MTIASRAAHFACYATIDAFDQLVPENRGMRSDGPGAVTQAAGGGRPWI